MPRETVYGEQRAFDPNEQNPKVPVAEVLWGRETGYVQIVTKAQDANGGRYASDSTETHFTDGMYVDLDRNGVNQFIRNLRRARDQAFGKDE